jgi:hypothetical protein
MSTRQLDPELEEGLDIVPDTPSSPSPSLNPVSISVGDKILVLGASQSGKSTLIERLIRDNQHKFDVIWAFCGTLKVSSNYKWNEPFLIDLSIPEQLGEDTHITQIKKIIRLQQFVAEKFSEGQAPKMLLIFDDCLNVNFYKDAFFWGAWMSSLRHYAITVIYSVQTLHETIGPNIRGQMDKVYMFANQCKAELVMSTVPGFRHDNHIHTGRKAFDLISEILAEPYQCVFFDNRQRVLGHTFKAKPALPFVLSYGTRAVRRY